MLALINEFSSTSKTSDSSSACLKSKENCVLNIAINMLLATAQQESRVLNLMTIIFVSFIFVFFFLHFGWVFPSLHVKQSGKKITVSHTSFRVLAKYYPFIVYKTFNKRHVPQNTNPIEGTRRHPFDNIARYKTAFSSSLLCFH